MMELPLFIGSTLEQLNKDLAELRQEIVMIKGGDHKNICHFKWQGKTRFIILSQPAYQAL